MTGIIFCVVEQAVTDQVNFNQVRAMAHQQQGVRIGNGVQAVADTLGTQQQGVFYMLVRFINFTGVNGQVNRRILAA